MYAILNVDNTIKQVCIGYEPLNGVAITDDIANNPNDYVYQNGQFVYSSSYLNKVKLTKKAELQASSDKSCMTFQSSALGSTKTYLADEKSMTFLAGEYAFVKSPDYDNSTTDWFTIEDNTFVTHTGAQIARVFLDGRSWIKQQKSVNLKSKFADVDAATTVDQVNAITW